MDMYNGLSRVRRCANCGRQFWAARRDKKTCSDKCRKALSRRGTAEDAIKALYDDANGAIQALAGYAGHGREYDWRAARRLQALGITLLEYSSDDVKKKLYQQLRDYIHENNIEV